MNPQINKWFELQYLIGRLGRPRQLLKITRDGVGSESEEEYNAWYEQTMEKIQLLQKELSNGGQAKGKAAKQFTLQLRPN